MPRNLSPLHNTRLSLRTACVKKQHVQMTFCTKLAFRLTNEEGTKYSDEGEVKPDPGGKVLWSWCGRTDQPLGSGLISS